MWSNSQPRKKSVQCPMRSVKMGRFGRAKHRTMSGNGWRVIAGSGGNHEPTANVSGRSMVWHAVRSACETVRRLFPLTVAEVDPFVRGMLFMYVVYTVALIVSTYLGMRTTGRL